MLMLIVTADDASLRWTCQVSEALIGWDHRWCGDVISASVTMTCERFDLVLVDQDLRGEDPLEFVRAIRSDDANAHVPVILTAGTRGASSSREAFRAGVTGIVYRDEDPHEAATWLHNLLSVLTANRAIEMPGQSEALLAREQDLILRLTRAVEYRDNDTGDHTLRVAHYSEMLAEELGLPATTCGAIRLAAPLHDIGKVAIPDHLLLKPGRLTEEEMAVVRTHAQIGERVLGGSDCALIRLAADIAGYHHERWDGLGYPRQVGGTDIPLSARIVAVADVFDAMTTHRPYKAALPVQEVLDHIQAEAGRHFDPCCAEAFVKAYRAKYAFFHLSAQGTPDRPGFDPVADDRPSRQIAA